MTSLTAAYVVAFLLYIGIFMRVPLIPLFSKELGASTAEIGIIASSFMIIASILSIPLGALSDSLGRKRLILAGIFLSAVGSFLLFEARTPGQIMVAYALAGIGTSCFAPAMASLIGDISSKVKLGQAYGWYTSAVQVGMASGPAIGGIVAGYFGYANAFVVSGIFITVGFLLTLFFLNVSSEESRKVNIANTISSFTKISGDKKIVALWVATLSTAFAFGVFQPFFPLYAQSIGLSVFLIGIIFGVNSLFNAFARILTGHISDKVGKRSPFILGGMIIFAIVIALIVNLTNFYSLLAIAALAGITLGTTNMAISASIAESTEHENRGVAMGGFSTSLYGGYAISAFLGGYLISLYGFRTSFLTTSAVCLIGAMIFYLMRK